MEPTTNVYSDRTIFDDERLMRERELLLGEMRDDITSFLQGIIDDYHVLNTVEEEAIKRGLLKEHSPMPFIIGAPKQPE
jgi:hypothetical protein